ncbi:MAG: HIRAN domain-containing protein [Clostridia bacterium]|nr:HIRAN domain-containing protein [Clostridia bacterium]
MLNKSNICKVANKLHKQGYTLSQAFKMAWRLAKNKAVVKVAGVSKGNRQTAIKHLEKYAADTVNVTLAREQANKFDSNAIAVYVSVKGSKAYKIGYIQACIAKLLSEIMDNITTIKASLKAITGGFYEDMLQGLLLNLSI